MKGVTGESLDSRDAGQLGPVERTVAHDEELGGHPVAPVGEDAPAQARVVPPNRRDLGRETRALVEVEVPGDPPTMFEDLRGTGVLLARDVAGLLQEREVDIGLDIALSAWISVPIPGPAEVATLLDDPKIVDARLARRAPVMRPAKPPPMTATVTSSSNEGRSTASVYGSWR